MNSTLAHADDDEMMRQFVVALSSGDMRELGRLMADYNALQRPDGDKLKSALQPKGSLLMGGEAEALAEHQDTRQALGLMMEWTQMLVHYDIGTTFPPKLLAAWASIAGYFLKSRDFKGLQSLVEFMNSEDARKAQTGIAGLIGSPEQQEKAKEFMTEFMPLPREVIFGKEQDDDKAE